MKAVLCPVCNGSGKYLGNPCHGCDGRGWVEVKEDYYYPPCEYPYTYPYYDSDRWYWDVYSPPYRWHTISEEHYSASETI